MKTEANNAPAAATFHTDSALKIAARDKGVTCKADSAWNEYRITAPGVAVVTVDRGHTGADRLEARAEAWAIVQRMAAEAEAPSVEAMQAEAQRAGGLIFPPSTLNGYPVTAIQDHKNGFFTVMVIRDAHAAPDHARLAVATWWRGLGNSWAWGHYVDGDSVSGATEAQAEAESTFKDVAKRNARRAPVN